MVYDRPEVIGLFAGHQASVRTDQVKLLVYNPIKEVIVRWNA